MPTADAPDPLGPGASPVRTLVADGSTGRRLVWSLTRYVIGRPWFWRPYSAILITILVGAAVTSQDAEPEQVHWVPFWSTFLLLAVIGRLVYDAVRLGRSARSAPSGTELRWRSSDQGFRLDHATASFTLPWSQVARLVTVGQSVLLLFPGNITPVPRELLGEELERVRQLVDGGRLVREQFPDGPPTPFVAFSRLPHVLRCTPSTARHEYRDFVRRRLRQRRVSLMLLALLATAALAICEPSWTSALLLASLALLAAQWAWSLRAARSVFDRSYPPGWWLAADVVHDELVVETPSARLSLSLRGLRDVRDRPGGVQVRTVSDEVAGLPHGLLPETTLASLRAAARGPSAG